MFWTKLHRRLALVLVVPLVVWSITGLLFHVKPGWDRAYDQLAIARENVVHARALVPIAQLGDVTKLELFDTALGPLYRVRTAAGTSLVDATTGAPRKLDEPAVRTLVADAVARSPHRTAYGAITGVALADGTARVAFSGGPIVELGLDDARISQRGGDTDRIDWLYRIHYMQWTGHRTLDRVFAVCVLLLIWAVMVPALISFVVRTKLRATR